MWLKYFIHVRSVFFEWWEFPLMFCFICRITCNSSAVWNLWQHSYDHMSSKPCSQCKCNPCHVDKLEMPHPLTIFSLSDYLIQVLIQIHILNAIRCRFRSAGFRSQLIWICTVCKGRAYPGSAGPGLTTNKKNGIHNHVVQGIVNLPKNLLIKCQTTIIITEKCLIQKLNMANKLRVPSGFLKF